MIAAVLDTLGLSGEPVTLDAMQSLMHVSKGSDVYYVLTRQPVIVAALTL